MPLPQFSLPITYQSKHFLSLYIPYQSKYFLMRITESFSWSVLIEICLLYCWEPPWEIPPMTKVMRRKPDRQRWIRIRGTPWTCSSIYPKTRVCLTILCLSPTLLTLTGGYPQPPFSGENQLRALANKSPGHERSISIQTLLLAF